MISGKVNADLEAIIRLSVRGAGAIEIEFDALVDSGCDSSLILPARTVAQLGLVRESDGTAVLADGSIRRCDIFAAELQWNGHWQPVLVLAIGGEALVGMQLLAGHRFLMDVVPGGVVEIAPLP